MAEDKQYVCWIKRRTGAVFHLYEVEATGEIVVKTLREFLDHEIKRAFDPTILLKVSWEAFVKDIDEAAANSKLAALLGWNYAFAARLAEKDGAVFILIAHPKFEAKPFSFAQVRDDDAYARHVVELIWSIRGGEIVFQEYDPVVHFPGCEFRRSMPDRQ